MHLKKKKKDKGNNEGYSISLHRLKAKISGYGYEYSFLDFMKATLLVFAGIIFAGYLYKLKIECILICLVSAILMMPLIIGAQFQYIYEQKRFSEVISYLEQMIYSFKKRPKILLALEETEDIMSGRMKGICQKAIAYIQSGTYKKELYLEAFAMIEREYQCERVVTLHRFLGQIEKQGGDYQSSINILLNDIKSWCARTYEYQKDRKRIKNNITLAIGLALFICFATTRMMPPEFSVTGNPIYQVTTTVTIVCMIVLFTFIQSKLSGTWMKNKRLDESRVEKDYELAIHCNIKKLRKKVIPLLLLMSSCAGYGIYTNKTQLTIVGILGVLLLYLQPKSKIKAARNRTIREIEKTFPLWLRNLALNLQRENVQVAISNSIPQAPLILRQPLNQLKKDFNQDPVSIRPYANFLKEFDLPEISSAMKMLYTLNGTGKKEVLNQVDTLVERNTKMIEKAERLREEDAIVATGFLVAIPMMVSLVKLVTDIMLIILNFLSKMSV